MPFMIFNSQHFMQINMKKHEIHLLLTNEPKYYIILDEHKKALEKKEEKELFLNESYSAKESFLHIGSTTVLGLI